MVRTDTAFLPGHDAALVRLKGTKKALAVSTDVNGLYCWLDPYEGGKIAVAEAARNVACSGARPLAVTDCLNFGNPMKPDVFWTFRRAVEGIRDACLKFNTPVTGGNVSFYNESPKGAIYPTPTVGLVGLLEDADRRVPSFFQHDGDLIFLVGDTWNELGGSQYLLTICGLRAGLPPLCDLDHELALQNFLVEGAGRGIFRSAHDLSEGGLAVALAECLLGVRSHPKGCEVDLAFGQSLRRDALLFGETQGRVILSIDPEQEPALRALAERHRLPIYELGKVGGQALVIRDHFAVSSREIESTYRQAIARRMRNS